MINWNAAVVIFIVFIVAYCIGLGRGYDRTEAFRRDQVIEILTKCREIQNPTRAAEK